MIGRTPRGRKLFMSPAPDPGTAPDSIALSSRVAHGVMWMGGGRIVVRLLGFVSTLILARLLLPADFGVVALATSVIAILELLTSFTFEIALIQKADLARSHLDTVWTLTLLFNTVIAALLLLLAAPAAHFYREPRLEPVLYALSLNQIISGFANIGTVYFRRQLNFSKDFILQVSTKVAGFLTTVPLAFVLRNYWALVLGMLVANLATTTVSYVMHSYRPRLSLSAWRELLGFSVWLLLNNFFTFLRNRSADLIIGRLLGAYSVGVFSLSYEIASLPTTEGVAAINRVVFPAYIKVGQDEHALQQAFANVLSVIAVIMLPLTVGIASVAGLAVAFLLGDRWTAAGPIVAALAIYSALSCLQTNTGPVYNALGKPRIILVTGVIHLTTLVPLLVAVASTRRVEFVAWAFTLHAAVIGFPTTYILFVRHTPVRFAAVIGAIWRPTVAAAVMYLAVHATLSSSAQVHGMSPGAQLAAAVAVGGATYAGLIAALWWTTGSSQSAEARLWKWALSRGKSPL